MQVDSSLPSTSFTVPLVKTFTDNATQVELMNPHDRILKKKIKTLQQKVRRKNVKISNMKDVIKEIKKCGYSNENLDIVLGNYFEG